MQPPVEHPRAEEIQHVHFAPYVEAVFAGEIHEMFRKEVAPFADDRFRDQAPAHLPPVFRDVEHVTEGLQFPEYLKREKRTRAFRADGAVRVKRVMAVTNVQVLRGRGIVRHERRLLGTVEKVAVIHQVEAFRGEPRQKHHVDALDGIGTASVAQEFPELPVGVPGRGDVVAANALLQEQDGRGRRERGNFQMPPRMDSN